MGLRVVRRPLDVAAASAAALYEAVRTAAGASISSIASAANSVINALGPTGTAISAAAAAVALNNSPQLYRQAESVVRSYMQTEEGKSVLGNRPEFIGFGGGATSMAFRDERFVPKPEVAMDGPTMEPVKDMPRPAADHDLTVDTITMSERAKMATTPISSNNTMEKLNARAVSP